MAARTSRHLTREQQELVARSIAAGEFRDLDDFEDFAVRQALAQLRLRQLRDVIAKNPMPDLTKDEILRQARAVRRALARR